MESCNKIIKMATFSTKKLKMKKLKSKKEKARRKVAISAGKRMMRRTLFFFTVPAWVNEYDELIEVFRPFGAIAKMELFGSDVSDHWGIVDFHLPVAEFAREGLDPIMEVKVASAEKSEERRKDRLKRERSEKRRAMKMIKRPKTTSEEKDRLPKTSSEQKERPAASQVSLARDPLEQDLGFFHHAALDSAEADRSGYLSDDMLVDAVYGEWDSVLESILLESAAALATANIGNPLLVVTPPPAHARSTRSGAADKDWERPVAGGDGMFSYHREA